MADLPARAPIAIMDLAIPAFGLWDQRWLLLTAGENRPGGFNSMTVSWGALGFIWGKPLAVVVVRPQRYTYEFMERGNTFSLCTFPPAFHDVLNLLGTKSGRDSNKMAECGLTPIALAQIPTPGFAQADLILECRKTYFDDLEPRHFLADYIPPLYRNDYHRVYFGEVLAIAGTAEYRRSR